MTKRPIPIEGLHLGNRVKLSDAALAKNADITSRGKIGEVVEVREDGRVSVRFEGGRLLIGRSAETFVRLVELGLKAKKQAKGRRGKWLESA